jgi:hypothetical protein
MYMEPHKRDNYVMIGVDRVKFLNYLQNSKNHNHNIGKDIDSGMFDSNNQDVTSAPSVHMFYRYALREV